MKSPRHGRVARIRIAASLVFLQFSGCASAQPAATGKTLPPAATQTPATKAAAGTSALTLPLDAFAGKPAPAGKHVGVFATVYVAWPAKEDAHGVAFVSSEGHNLGVKVSVWDFCNAGDESTVIVSRAGGGTVTLSTAGKADKPFTDCHGVFKTRPDYAEKFARSTYRLTPVDAPYGLGSQPHWRLVPYRSVAVKQGGRFKNGTVLYMKSLVGKPFTAPNGKAARHDGYVMVADIGDMTLDQIDFYKGATQNQTVPFASDAQHLVDAIVVTDPAIIAALRAEHNCVCAEPGSSTGP